MPSNDPSSLPNVAEILAGVLQRIPHVRQPLLIAYAERLAADRYRAWASDSVNLRWKDQLAACAARELEIASRIEGLYPDGATLQRAILADNPDLEAINRTLFAGRPLAQQFTIQAQGERLGAATWRALAAQARDAVQSSVLLGCAELEEQNAAVLERILGGASPS